MSDEPDVAPLTFLGDGEISFAAEPGLRLDEIHSFICELIHSATGIRGRLHNNGRLIAGWVAVKIGSSKENLRPEPIAMLDFIAQIPQVLHFPSHVADSGDAIREKKRNDEFAAPIGFSGSGEVHVHVGEAGDEEFASGVENSRSAQSRCRF